MVALLPYHNIAMKKFEKLGKNYQEIGMEKPSDVRVEIIREQFQKQGFNVNIGG